MKYLVFDTESCTGRDNDGSLCSVGIALYENGSCVYREDVICNPLPKRFTVGDKRDAKRTGVTFAYSVSEFRKAPKFCDIYSKIKRFFDCADIAIGFSMGNDVKYLNDACDKYSLPRIRYKFLDAQFVYQLLSANLNSIGLKKLADKYGIDYLEHRSDEDAVVAAEVLKKTLEEYSVSFEEFIKKYGVHYGENRSDGYYNNFADAVFREEFGLKRSRKLQSEILGDYLSKISKKGGNKVCFSVKIERSDVNFVRTLIDLAYKSGFTYTNNADRCSVFVSDGENDVRKEIIDKIKRRKVQKLSLDDFKNVVGYKNDFKYDDVDFLTKKFTALCR